MFTKKGIVAVFTNNQVVATTGKNGVIAITALKDINPITGLNRIVAITTGDDIIALCVQNHVIACESGDDIGRNGPDNKITACRAVHFILSAGRSARADRSCPVRIDDQNFIGCGKGNIRDAEGRPV